MLRCPRSGSSSATSTNLSNAAPQRPHISSTACSKTLSLVGTFSPPSTQVRMNWETTSWSTLRSGHSSASLSHLTCRFPAMFSAPRDLITCVFQSVPEWSPTSRAWPKLRMLLVASVALHGCFSSDIVLSTEEPRLVRSVTTSHLTPPWLLPWHSVAASRCRVPLSPVTASSALVPWHEACQSGTPFILLELLPARSLPLQPAQDYFLICAAHYSLLSAGWTQWCLTVHNCHRRSQWFSESHSLSVHHPSPLVKSLLLPEVRHVPL